MEKGTKLELLNSDIDLIQSKIEKLIIQRDYHTSMAKQKADEIDLLTDRSQILIEMLEERNV